MSTERLGQSESIATILKDVDDPTRKIVRRLLRQLVVPNENGNTARHLNEEMRGIAIAIYKVLLGEEGKTTRNEFKILTGLRADTVKNWATKMPTTSATPSNGVQKNGDKNGMGSKPYHASELDENSTGPIYRRLSNDVGMYSFEEEKNALTEVITLRQQWNEKILGRPKHFEDTERQPLDLKELQTHIAETDEWPWTSYARVTFQKLEPKATKMHERWMEVRNDIVSHNIRLIESIAKRYRNRGLPFSDLMQEGARGLLVAIDKYDFKHDAKLGTYATWWIRRYIQMAVQQKAKTLKMGKHHPALFARIKHLEEHEPHLTKTEIAKRLDVSVNDVFEAYDTGCSPVSLSDKISDDFSDDRGSMLEDDTEAPPNQGGFEVADMLVSAITRGFILLKEANIISMRFGLGYTFQHEQGKITYTFDPEQYGKNQMLKEIEFGRITTKEGIRLIEKSGMRKLIDRKDQLF